MDILGGLPLPLALAVLALIDGLSVGTLLIPVFLLLSPGKVRAGRIVLYLLTIAGFYLGVGLLFLWGLVNLVDVASDLLASPVGLVGRLVFGVALLIAAFVIPVGEKAKATPVVAGRTSDAAGSHALLPADAEAPAGASTAASAVERPGRITRWRERLLDPRTRRTAVMAVAIAAGVAEVATMLPYIVAMTMLADVGVDTPMRVIALVGYCALMIAPALLLLVLRTVAAPLVQRPLERFAGWMQRTGAENTAWIIGIIGFLIARTAADELGLFGRIGGLGQ